MKKLVYCLFSISLALLSISINVSAETNENGNIVFQDSNFKNVLIQIGVDINKDGEISISEAESTIRIITPPDAGITNISGLEYFVNLEEFNLQSGSNITEIRPISSLYSLKKLHISWTDIEDISPLKDLTDIEYLSIFGTKVSDLTPLVKLTKINTLLLPYNNIDDVSPIENLTNIKDLWLYNNNIHDIEPIRNLYNITRLIIGDNKISDISPLENLTNLDRLKLNNNMIEDVSCLSGLKNLTFLNLGNNDITEISSLSELKYLTGMLLYKNKITDISSLSGLENLSYLDLSQNQITDISSLSKLKNLTSFYLGNNPINNEYTQGAIHKENLDFEVSGTKYEVWVVDNTQNNNLINKWISGQNTTTYSLIPTVDSKYTLFFKGSIYIEIRNSDGELVGKNYLGESIEESKMIYKKLEIDLSADEEYEIRIVPKNNRTYRYIIKSDNI